ncbi:hypothetical protein NPA08_02320 [Mycoplasmopsis citelli]|uniref:hypothetical protein n=1 Tax=Mycoplasmopsis citelli TaxID=171281 RepID=UPI0021143EAD|nr:hypothetical protein [Mycoplasmopsis citelli]UUD35781.1 hypothetical protein NPA08_02320 [Mycoplasmopsis citelli]
MYTENQNNKETFDYLNKHFNFKINQFLNTINEYIRVLDQTHKQIYIELLDKILSSNNYLFTKQNEAPKRAIKLHLAIQILILNPDLYFLRVVERLLENQLEYDQDFWFIQDYLNLIKVDSGKNWLEYLNGNLTKNKIKSDLFLLSFQVQNLHFTQYYQLKNNNFQWVLKDDLTIEILNTLKRVLLFLNEDNWWEESQTLANNLKFLKEKYDFDILISSKNFLEQVSGLDIGEQMIFIKNFEDIINSELIKDENFNLKIIKVLNQNSSVEIIFKLASSLEDKNILLKFLQDI